MSRVWEQLQASTREFAETSTIADLKDAASRFITSLGFSYITCATVRHIRGTALHEGNFATWPSELTRKFSNSGLLQHDPIIIQSRTTNTAFFWTLDVYDPDNAYHAQILEIRRAVGVTGGCCAPVPERVCGGSGGRLVLYVTGVDIVSNEEVRVALQLAAAQVAARLAALNQSNDESPYKTRFFETTGLLSPREKVILSWVASGKSSWTIAQILSISEHTVNQHIERASKKLEASNRTEAVVKALVINELQLNPDLKQ